MSYIENHTIVSGGRKIDKHTLVSGGRGRLVDTHSPDGVVAKFFPSTFDNSQKAIFTIVNFDM